MDPGSRGPSKGALAVVFGLIVWTAASAEATAAPAGAAFVQVANGPGGNTPNPSADDVAQEKDDSQADRVRGIFPPPDRTLLRLLGKAGQLVDQHRYAEAVRCLGAILDSPEDHFFQPDKSGPVHRSLKSEAQRLLGQMPRQGRELYELQYGVRARQLLIDAAVAGDAFELADVSRRFFHTQAGYEATLLLALYHLNEGRPLGWRPAGSVAG